MQEAPSIVLIGAGSASFGLTMLHDVYSEPLLERSTLWLVDLDPEAVERTRALAAAVEAATNRSIDVRCTSDRLEALPGADVVIVAVEVDRVRRWVLDYEVPRSHGVMQIYGENGGPGGLSHALRTIPLVEGIALDVARLAPDAVLLNFTNPEGRVCTAMRRHHPEVNIVGLCHEVSNMTNLMAPHLDRGPLRWRAAGLNHFTWLLEATDEDGRDVTDELPLLDALDKVAAESVQETYGLVRYLYERFGTMVATSDSHVGEYFPFAHEHVAPLDVEGRQVRMRAFVDSVASALRDGTMDWDLFWQWESGEAVLPILRAAITGDPQPVASAILPNDGLIPVMPTDCAVEVSATATADGLVGDVSDDLPAALAGVLNLEVAIQQLTADAALTGSRDAALEALLVDPVVGSSTTAEAVLLDLEEAHAGVWPVLT